MPHPAPNGRPPLRVVVAVDRYMPESFGGGEQQARKLALALIRQGSDATILTPRRTPNTKLLEYEGALAVHRFNVFLHAGWKQPAGISFVLWSVQVFAWLIWNHRRYDVVHVVHAKPYALPVLLAAALLGKSSVIKPGTGGRRNDFAKFEGQPFGRFFGYLCVDLQTLIDVHT